MAQSPPAARRDLCLRAQVQAASAPIAELAAEVIARGEFGERTLRFDPVPDFFAVVEKLGHVPLPPYIAREDRQEDRERYQTVYARAETTGSVAAPTLACTLRGRSWPIYASAELRLPS